MEKAGKPSVGIVSVGFERNAMATAGAYGLPQFRYALVREVLTGLPPERIEQEVVDAFDQIIAVLTTEADGLGSKPVALKVKPAERLTIEGDDWPQAFENMNRQFLSNEWGDGFPLIPPTPQKVAEMLKGTTRDPSDVITVLAPGNGLATVEKIAINAVMAGCEPVHLPILMATCEAYMGLGTRVRQLAMSTSAHAPLLVINGPIAKEIGINSKQCALGPGHQSRHNIVIGRALRLMMINIGNCRPGRMDMDTIGSARKFSMCVAENEEESPWPAFHVEKGYDKDTSTVTVFATRDEIDAHDLHSWTPEGFLSSIASCSAIPGGEHMMSIVPGTDPYFSLLLVICPEHANICGKAGWDKKAVREYVYHHCRISAKRLIAKAQDTPEVFRPQWQWLLKKSEPELDQMLLSVMESTDDIDIIVVGGPAGKNVIYRGIARPSTAVIKDRA